jgi:predicted enzyme related to lactoylglutathione lyase
MPELEILGLDNVLLAVGDFAAAREFYSGKVGLPVKFELEQFGVIGLRLGPEEAGLLLRVQDGLSATPPVANAPRFWLEVPDARAAGAAMMDAGVEPLADPREINTGWVIEFADPWGNVFGLTDYVKQPERGRRR